MVSTDCFMGIVMEVRAGGVVVMVGVWLFEDSRFCLSGYARVIMSKLRWTSAR